VQPILAAIDSMAAHCDSYWPRVCENPGPRMRLAA